MRIDYIEQLNTALEAKATFLDQVISMHEAEIQKLKTMARALRGLASKDAAEGDPVIDGQPFSLPSIFRRPATPAIGGQSTSTAATAERAVSEAVALKAAG